MALGYQALPQYEVAEKYYEGRDLTRGETKNEKDRHQEPPAFIPGGFYLGRGFRGPE